ncbi:hypothetical protein GOV14_03440 [Candidatus Pacearchaeota archaeon]|nr:hypothetical protein [Candidatus Pacearchaeota archaeon]
MTLNSLRDRKKNSDYNPNYVLRVLRKVGDFFRHKKKGLDHIAIKTDEFSFPGIDGWRVKAHVKYINSHGYEAFVGFLIKHPLFDYDESKCMFEDSDNMKYLLYLFENVDYDQMPKQQIIDRIR